MAAKPPGRGYRVGWGRPPRDKQFKKGQSGNAKGRPKGSKNLSMVLKKALTEKVTITENGKRRRITKLEVMTKQLVNKAATGDPTSMKMLLGLIHLTEDRSDSASPPPLPLDETDEKIMKELSERLQSMLK